MLMQLAGLPLKLFGVVSGLAAHFAWRRREALNLQAEFNESLRPDLKAAKRQVWMEFGRLALFYIVVLSALNWLAS